MKNFYILFFFAVNFVNAQVNSEMSFNEYLGMVKKFHPLVKEAELKVISACTEAGISCGTQLSDFNTKSVEAALQMGYTFIIASSDLFVLDSWANGAERVMQGFRK